MNNRTQIVIAHLSRTLLGLTFIFSGTVKAIDPLGTTYKIEDYLTAFGGFFTDLLPLAQAAAIVLIAVEFVLGVCLTLNVRTSLTSWLSLIFYMVMTPLTLYIALNNPVSDCGCFGDAIVLTNWQTFWKNIVLSALVILLLLTKKYTHQLWLNKIEAYIASSSLIVVIGFMIWTIYHLPVIDFRPYKIGNHLPTLMEYPDDAEQDQFLITFTYSKDGFEQDFTIDNYPKNDSAWTFVRQNSTLIKKGYEPPIHDFEIINTDYEDITYDILESETPVTLVVMYDLKKTDLSQTGKLLSLYSQCSQQGQELYILTGAGEDERERFCEQNNMQEVEHLFCTCDPVTLKTIVRANPGVVVIENGIVIDKYNLRNR